MKNLQMSILAALMFACGDGGSDKKSDATGQSTSNVDPAEVLAAEVNATDKDNWVGFDLDGNKHIASADLAADTSWDLAFKKTAIKVQGTVSVATLRDVAFDDVTDVPADAAFVSDQPVEGGKETDGLAFHSPGAWYSYNMEIHVISSNNYVYLVKSSDGKIYKLALTDYYNADRLPAYVQVKWQLLQTAE